MINDELKIKIIQYLDGELDQGSEKEIEEILNTDKNANDFCNQMKSLDINLKAFMHTSEYKAYSERADKIIDLFIDEHIDKQDSFSLSFLNFKPKIILNYALTAALFVGIGINLDSFIINNDNNETINIFEEFKYSNIKIEYFETKSSSSSDFEKILLKSLEETINKKSLSATITVGLEIYRISLNNKIIDDYNVKCFQGQLLSKNENKEFIFCNNNNTFSLSYL